MLEEGRAIGERRRRIHENSMGFERHDQCVRDVPIGLPAVFPSDLGERPAPELETRRLAQACGSPGQIGHEARHAVRLGNQRIRRKFDHERALPMQSVKHAPLELPIKNLSLEEVRRLDEFLERQAHLEIRLCNLAQFGLVDLVGEYFKER